MPSPALRRRTLALLLATALAASWAAAAGPKAATAPRPASATAAVHQDLLSRTWSLLASLWGEEGCHIDPNGRCATGAAQPVPPKVHTDTGCHIDPDGRCASSRGDTSASPSYYEGGAERRALSTSAITRLASSIVAVS